MSDSNARDGARALIRTFNTHSMDDASVAALMTGRTSELDEIVATIERNRAASPGTLQHAIVYAPRGFGKSFLMRAVQLELERRGNPSIAFVLLPEEQHNLTRNPHGLLEYVAAKLADHRTGEDASWSGSMFSWPDPEREDAEWHEAGEALERELDANFGTDTESGASGLAVVVVENFDILMTTVFKSEVAQQRLRGWMTRGGNRVMILATATGSVDLDYERPLFHAFRAFRLPAWTQPECIDYFNRRRAYLDRPALGPDEEAKVRAIAEFIGGTPRLAQVLADVLDEEGGFSQGEPLSVAAIMANLADRLGEYYRRRIEDLPALARGLLDALIRGGEPCSATELARRVRAEGQSTIARSMLELQSADIVRGAPAPDGRETLYRVADRVLAHYFRLRQGNQEAISSPLETILDFLRAFYTADERQIRALRYLEQNRPAEADTFARLAQEVLPLREKSTYSLDFPMRLERWLSVDPIAWPIPVEDLMAKMRQSPGSIATDCQSNLTTDSPLQAALHRIVQAQALVEMGLVSQAEETLRSACNDAKGGSVAELIVHSEGLMFVLYESASHSFATIIDSYSENISQNLPPNLIILASNIFAHADALQGRHAEAISKLVGVAELADQHGMKEDQFTTIQSIALSLEHLNRDEEALANIEEAIAIAINIGDKEKHIIALQGQAGILIKLNRLEDLLLAATEIDSLSIEIRNRDAQWYAQWIRLHALINLGRHQDVIVATEESTNLAIDENDKGKLIAVKWIKAASLMSVQRFEEALETSNEVITLATQEGDEDRLSDALWISMVALGNLERDVESYDVAKQLASLSEDTGNKERHALAMSNQAWFLAKSERYEEAIDASTKSLNLAIEIADVAACIIYETSLAAILRRSGRHAEALQHALLVVEREDRKVEEISTAVVEVLLSALFVPLNRSLEVFAAWVDSPTKKASTENKFDAPEWWIGEALGAAVRARAWTELDRFLRQRGEWIETHAELWSAFDMGTAIARVGTDEGRATGFEAARGVLSRWERLGGEPEQGRLTDLMSAFAEACQDPGLLRDVAGLLTDAVAPDAPMQARLLTSLADADEDPSGGALARTDPDIALWIRRIRHLPEDPPRPRKRRK